MACGTRSRATLGVGAVIALLAMLALAACGGSSGLGAKPTPTATPDAATILQKAKEVQYPDIEFTMTLSGTAVGTSVNGTGSGTVTTSPKRAKITLSFTVSGQQLTIDGIIDEDSNTMYLKLSGLDLPGLSSDK